MSAEARFEIPLVRRYWHSFHCSSLKGKEAHQGQILPSTDELDTHESYYDYITDGMNWTYVNKEIILINCMELP